GYVDEQEKIDTVKNARGFILLSSAESGCIAVLEAFAMGRPAFLPDLDFSQPSLLDISPPLLPGRRLDSITASRIGSVTNCRPIILRASRQPGPGFKARERFRLYRASNLSMSDRSPARVLPFTLSTRTDLRPPRRIGRRWRSRRS
ncbi:MAG: glycosyltransferase, partial [Planctomycetes bacterium]|nr:glycosyltransferase [Planctomycetota bacterium]